MDPVLLCSLIRRLNPKELLEPFHDMKEGALVIQDLNVFHVLVEELLNRQTDGDESSEVYAKAATQIVYLLSTYGADVNHQDENGDTALLCYLRAARTVPIADDLVVAFLRCGTDSCLKNKDGEDILQYILQRDELPKDIRARVLEYMPGVWRAVDSDDSCAVRRLINQWCHVKRVKDGISVLQLAYSKGTENIIRVVSGIGPSMDVAHSVLAGDFVTVKRLLDSTHHVNINLKNMADGGATPVFYAMCNNDWPMTELLLKHGARLDCGMHGDNQMELPLYFAALSHKPAIDTDILKCTIPRKPVHVDQLYYKGKNVIFYCIEHQVNVQLFREILKTCSAHVLTERIENNFSAREYAMLFGLDPYVSTIDIVVSDWCTQEESSGKLTMLCLHGYMFLLPLTFEEGSHNEKLAKYMQLVGEFEDFKSQLREATVTGNAVCVREMLNTESWSDRGLDVCLADSRVYGDGQPLLHKAVLHGHTDVVTELVQYVIDKSKKKLDSFRDQYFRTALHYVYGMEDSDSKALVNILEDNGMSEYSMDKDGRSPLAFKDRRGLKEMKDLLEYHRLQDFTEPEPDPWSVNLPLPITGFLKQCLHDHHRKKKHKHVTHDRINSDQAARKIKHEHSSHHKSKPREFTHIPQVQVAQPPVNSIYMREPGRLTETTSPGSALRYQKPLHYDLVTDGLGNYYQRYTDAELLYVQNVSQPLKHNGEPQYSHQLVNKVVSINPQDGGNFRSDIFQQSSTSTLANEKEGYFPKLASLRDVSDVSSDSDGLEEDYEGDQSDVESDADDEGHSDRHCSIL